MTSTRWLVAGWALLVLPLATPAQEPKSALASVPAGSPIVLQVHGIERTKNRLLTLVKNAVPDLAQNIQAAVDGALKQALAGRELTGLAAEGPVFIVFTEIPKPGDSLPAVAIVLRTTDAAAFRKGLFTEDERKAVKRDPAGFEEAQINNTPIYLVTTAGSVVITPKKEVATQFTKSGPGLDSKLNKEVAQRLLDADVSLYVDTAAINKEYGDQIKGGRQLLELILQQGETDANKAQMAMAKNIFTGLFQAFEDSRTFLLGFQFPPEGLALHGGVQIAPDTKTNDFLKSSKPADLGAVTTLPAGQMAYMSARFDAALGKALQPLLMGLMADPESEQGKALQKVAGQFAEAGPRGFLQSANRHSEGIQIGDYADPAKAAQAALAMFQAQAKGGSFNNMALKKAEVKTETHKHRGFELRHAELVWDFEKLAETQPGGKELGEFMKKFLGESMNIWFGTNGKLYVQISAKDWPGAQKYLDTSLDGQATIGKEQAFEEARKHLPAQATFLALYDLPQMAQFASEMLYPILKASGLGNLGEPPAVAKGKPSFGGGVVTLQSGQASFDLWFPGSSVPEFRKRFEPLIRGLQGK